jgi:hypothetical protein
MRTLLLQMVHQVIVFIFLVAFTRGAFEGDIIEHVLNVSVDGDLQKVVPTVGTGRVLFTPV